MISDADFDRSLRRWLADGDERAPASSVEAALLDVVGMPQRRPTMWGLPMRRSSRPAGRSLAAGVAVGMLALVTMLAIAVGGRRDPSPTPSPSAPIPSSAAVGPLRESGDQQGGIRLSVPSSWQLISQVSGVPAFGGFVQFGGSKPAGDMSVSFGAAFQATICTPACLPIDLPRFIPYSTTAVLDALASRLAAGHPGATWGPLPGGSIVGLDDARRLDVVARELSGRVSHQVFVIGIHSRGVIAFTWNQGERDYEAALVDEVLASIRITPVADYPGGTTMVEHDRVGDGYSVSLPDSWIFAQQPHFDVELASNVRRFGAGHYFAEGMAVVSVGDPDGSIRICDAACRLVPAPTTLDDLEAAVRLGGATSPARTIKLDGDEARTVDRPGQEWVFAFHGGRPVVLWFDVLDSAVDRSIVDEVVASFRFATPPVAAPNVFTSVDRTVEIALPDGWHQSPEADAEMHLASDEDELRLLRGDGTGRIGPCLQSAGAWEDCSTTRAVTLDRLAQAVAPHSPPAGCAINCDGPVTWTRDNVIVGGEPGFVTIVEARPRRGPEWVAYIGAIHHGQPVVIRVWRHSSEGSQSLDEIIAGIRFLD